MSKALAKFDKTYSRAFQMVGRHYDVFKEFLEDEAATEWDETHDDLFRTAIVLAVAAMDAYFTNRFCEGLIPYLKKNKPNKALIGRLEKAGFTTVAALEMFNMNRPNRRLSNLVRKDLESFVTQNFRIVDDLYSCFRFRSITKSAQTLARRKTLVSSVEGLVKRRHKIVHNGDYNTHGRLNSVNYTNIIRRMADLEKLVGKSDELMVKKGI